MGSAWIVIVNYRTAELAMDCLRALSSQKTDLGGGRVLVIDNDSGDGSVDYLNSAIERENWLDWAGVMPLDHNGGFAFGNNAGIRVALSSANHVDYVMLLNPDTVARPNAVKSLIEFMDAHPKVGIAGSLLENTEGGVECSAHCMHSPLSELESGARLGFLSRLLYRYRVSPPPSGEAHSCDWVSGASMMVRRAAIERVGQMDDGYFLYFEEVDFCWRIKRAGWEIWYVPQSRVMHLEGASTGIRVNAKRRAKYWYDSRRRFFVKHYGVIGLVVADMLWALGRSTLLLRRLLGLGGGSGEDDPAWFMADLLWGDLKALLSGKVWRIRQGQVH
jgi:GT2 family glycosyltransferase